MIVGADSGIVSLGDGHVMTMHVAELSVNYAYFRFDQFRRRVHLH
jgi:hypothetical protein